MKWHLVDNEWQSIYLHKDTHHHDDGEQAGSHKTELPPLDGYICGDGTITKYSHYTKLLTLV